MSTKPKHALPDAIDMSIAEFRRLRKLHAHWRAAWSGGKDSTCLVTLAEHAFESGQVERPITWQVIRSDTTQELAALEHAAQAIAAELRARGTEVIDVRPEQDKLFWVNILGRGVCVPNNRKARWCTRQLKQDPMREYMEAETARLGERPLMLVGSRLGESNQRDQSIAVACSRDGGECGQGRFYFDTPEDRRALPIAHWGACNVWGWLKEYAPNAGYGDWPTELLADAYGRTEDAERGIRTGCVGCPLVEEDRALTAVAALPEWSYLAPLAELSVILRELREPRHRLRKQGYTWDAETGELTGTGQEQRQGPIRLASRLEVLGRVLAIQERVNAEARRLRRPEQWIIPPKDEQRIRELIAAGMWPRGWDGTEPGADVPVHEVRADGSIQLNLFAGDDAA